MLTRKILMRMIFYFALIPVKRKAHLAYDDFVNDDIHVKDNALNFPTTSFILRRQKK